MRQTRQRLGRTEALEYQLQLGRYADSQFPTEVGTLTPAHAALDSTERDTLAITDCAKARASRSAFSTASSVSASRFSCLFMTSSITRGMSVSEIRSSINARTASSFAAFMAAGIVPPLRNARYASEMHGKRSMSGGSKCSDDSFAKSSGGS